MATPPTTEVELQAYSKFRAIAGVALPACLQNAAGPVTTALETALLANYAGSNALAAFAAVNTSANFATRIFNFLVDGVSAKVGKSVGQGAWGELAFRVQLALSWALGAGVVASALLAAVRTPVLQSMLAVSDDVLAQAATYWWLRCGLVPIQLFNMSLSGILQGYHQVKVSALLNSCQSLLELGGCAAVLVWRVPIFGAHGLLAVGFVTVATQLLLSAVGFACVLLLPPREAGARFRLLDAWLGRGIGASSGSSQGAEQRLALGSAASDDELKQPLLGTCDSVSSLPIHTAKVPGAQLLSGSCGSPLGSGASDEEEGLLEGQGSSTELGSGGQGGEATPPAIRSPGTPARAVWLLTGSSRQPGEGDKAEDPAAAAAAAIEAEQRREHMLDFVRDGLNMLIRSLVIQATFFASLVAASRLGTASLAAHSIIQQLWMVIAYVVDGFAAAGIVLGSRLAGHAHNALTAPAAKEQLQRLIRRVLGGGLVSGIAAGAVFQLYRAELMHLFTPDPAVHAVLSSAWLILVIAQPTNGLVYVYDGLMYASQSFSYIRNMMLLGLAFAFSPALLLEALCIHALWGIWLANVAVNVWRLCGAAWLIHGRFVREFDQSGGAQHQRLEPASDEEPV